MVARNAAVNTQLRCTAHPGLPVARLASRPLAIAPRALETLLAAASVAVAPQSSGTTRGCGYAVTGAGIAVVPVLGPLVARADWLSALFGACVYGEVGEAVEAALADPSVRGVVMEIDSPGGEVAGMFDLVDRLTALRRSVLDTFASRAEASAVIAAAPKPASADKSPIVRRARERAAAAQR
jgi:ClpP class serine protease